MKFPHCAIALLVLGVFCLLSSHRPAQAALQVCNRTSYVLYAATGWTTDSDNITQGWTRVVPGGCATPIKQMLTAKNYYLYARSSQAYSGVARAWGGKTQLCVKDANFALKTPITSPDCTSGDAFTLPFAPVDTHRMQSWTATLTESPAITNDSTARMAGIERLLRGNGYKFGNPKQRDEALSSFRAKLKIAGRATPAELFDALETEALKASSPAGYTICNDTAGNIWAALGFRDGQQTLAAGWWKIAAGACAHALTQPLKLDNVYIHAEGHNKPNLVSGPDKFCTTNITFQVAKTGDCKQRGLSETGFAVTHTKDRAGYTAHIGNNGLLRPQPSRPK
jgi:uncharacterized membrane protein